LSNRTPSRLHLPALPTKWGFEHARQKLTNGLTLVSLHRPNLNHCCLSAYIGTGSRFEDSTDNGVSHFLEHMMFRGTGNHPTAFDLNLSFERLGGTLGAATCADTTEYTITLPQDTLREGVELLSEVLTSPRMGEIDLERKIILEEIREDLGEHGEPIDVDFLSRARLWPNHPLGQAITGPPSNVERFTIDDLQSWYKRYYTAPNTVICIAGSFDAEKAIARIIECTDTLIATGTRHKTIPPEPPKNASVLHMHKPGSQTIARVSFLCPGLDSEDAVTTDVLLRLIDDGMSTPLHREIFEDSGLAYNAGAGLEGYPDTGALNIEATSSHENVPEIVERMLRICTQLRDKGIGANDEELHKAKSRALWNLLSYQDDPAGLCAWYGEQELYRRPVSLDRHARELAEVTQSDISRVAADIFIPASLHVTTVGVQDKQMRSKTKKTVEAFS